MQTALHLSIPLDYQPFVQPLAAPGLAVDVIGDIHGCAEELEALVIKAGYHVAAYDEDDTSPITLTHPEGRRLVLVGDITDRGPRPDLTLRMAMGIVATGTGHVLMGNHDWKLFRYLNGRKVELKGSVNDTVARITAMGSAFHMALLSFYAHLPHQIRIPLQRVGDPSGVAARWPGASAVWIVHGAAPEDVQGMSSRKAFDKAIYGLPTGESHPDGRPIREDWAESYRGADPVIHGHVVHPAPVLKNRVLAIDTGCAHGGALTLYRLDSDSFLQVASQGTGLQSSTA